MRGPLPLVIVWHFHQPDYTDPATQAPAMPWTRLHALKDYLDMAAHLDRHPSIRVTWNVVPSLLDQLAALARADAPPDRWQALALKPAAALTDEERRFVVGEFFSLHLPTMASDLKRLVELQPLRDPQRFDVQALRDLQVLFHLAWCGATVRADPRVARLVAKGRGFDEDDKAELFAAQREHLASVLPRWRALAASGRVELSVTPYFHPILPLLCDLGSAREALTGLALPRADFRHPEDADAQLVAGREAFERVFGTPALGGWPSEGAISEESLRRMAAAGYRWAASDEDVLFASLGETAGQGREALLHRAWRHGAGPVLLFRDHDLSDRLGFTYQGRDPHDAARDFVGRLLRIRELLPDDGASRAVAVILDGENAWERYPDLAVPFFDALYGAIAAEPAIRTVTASEAAQASEPAPLPRVVAGSWIYRNLATWIGHPEKNRAWELIAETRAAVASARGAPSWADPAWRAVFAAEGSDWMWWFGDDHPTPNASQFDALFRSKLAAAYAAIGKAVPDALRVPVRRERARAFSGPTGRVHPTLDGRVTDFFEWQAAGRCEAVYGAMQASARLVRQILYGSDGASLFVRVDPFEPGALDGATVRVEVAEREGAAPVVRRALDRVLEMEIPLAGPLRFAVVVERADGAHQRVPADDFAELPPPDADPARFDWSA